MWPVRSTRYTRVTTPCEKYFRKAPPPRTMTRPSITIAQVSTPSFNPMASRYEKVGVACIPCTLSVMVHERRLKSSIWMFAALFPH